MSLRVLTCSKFLHHQRKFQTSAVVLDFRWRKERGLPENPNSFGPLNTQPDYNFADGRPTPIGANLRRRLEKQRKYAEKIVQLSKEMDFAVKRHQIMKEEEETRRKNILQRKLTPKGNEELV